MSALNVVLPWTYAMGTSKDETQMGGADVVVTATKPATTGYGLSLGIISIILGIFAGSLAWNGNEKEDLGLRVIYTILAFSNAIPYLLYYLVIRVLLKAPFKCCGAF